APTIFSVEDFLTNISGIEKADNIEVLFQLFEIHKEVEGKSAQPFEEFINWAQQLIQDFNDVDSYLTDPEKLFGYLSEARALSVWNLDRNPLTDFQKKYLQFYQSLFQYYTGLRKQLLLRNVAYTGLLFRECALKISELAESIPCKKVVFAGFNALTLAEERIIGYLLEKGRAEIIWDADSYYLNDPGQEAGTFLRKWSGKWQTTGLKQPGNFFKEGEKEISITGVPFNIGQVKYCGDLLSKMITPESPLENTAVVLMDEQLLIPLLNSLPDNVGALNITMGLSLKNSPFYSFFESLFQLQENLKRFHHITSKGITRFYFRDVLRILQHPFVARLSNDKTGGNAFGFEELIESIRQGNKVFLKKEEIILGENSLFHQSLAFLEPVFTRWNSPMDAIGAMKKMIVLFRRLLIDGNPKKGEPVQSNGADIDLEFLFGFSKVVSRIDLLMKQFDTVGNLRMLHQLFNRISETTTLPFYGEPLKGLQVMGMLETRTLDFENIILLSVNEDLIPSGKTTHSFIPFDIRQEFGLPTYHHKNAVYAYH
ncbi:MAG: hypothetical protein WCL00_15920, partial [Bacteroidota bacterium]